MIGISIIVPIYNIENYIDKCIESIVNQTYRNLEIILVDDGSKDLSGKICDQYAEQDSRIKVIHKNNEGLVEARKTGVRAAKEEFILFVDGDDWIDRNTCEVLVDIIKNGDVDIVSFGYYRECGNNHTIYFDHIGEGTYSGEKLCQEFYKKVFSYGKFFNVGIFPAFGTKIFKKQLLEKNIFNVDSYITIGEDVAGVYPSIIDAMKIIVLKQAFYHYRYNESSMMKSFDEKYFERILLLNVNINESLSKKNKIDDKNIFVPYFIYLIINGIYEYVSRKNKQNSLHKIRGLKELVNKEEINRAFLIGKNLDYDCKNQKVIQLCIEKKVIQLYIFLRLEGLKVFLRKRDNE